jgi:hypothetical protein
LTTRERFNAIMHWQKPDRLPNVEFGYWEETMRVWHAQGLPSHLSTHEGVERYLGLEGISIFPEVPVKNGLFPQFTETILEQHDDRKILLDVEGNMVEKLLDDTSMPRYLRFGLQTRDDWERYKAERLDPRAPGRIGAVRDVVQVAHAAGMPVTFNGGSLYGWLRDWMGVEGFSIALMTDRAWVEEMIEHLTRMTLYLIEEGLTGVDVDIAWWWEDMCYNRGPLMSPRHFHELLVPRYKRITDALKGVGIDVNVLDCDGKIDALVPGWLEGGINCMFPIEVAHTDPFYLRETYGNKVLLLGGVNKVSLIRGKGEIDREIERLIPLVKQGGYIPCVDHRVPPDVSWENYLYYLNRKRELLEA